MILEGGESSSDLERMFVPDGVGREARRDVRNGYALRHATVDLCEHIPLPRAPHDSSQAAESQQASGRCPRSTVDANCGRRRTLQADC